MGWASGSDVAVTVIEAVKANVSRKTARRTIYELFYFSLKQHDWDTEADTLGIDPVWDSLMADFGVLDEEDD